MVQRDLNCKSYQKLRQKSFSFLSLSSFFTKPPERNNPSQIKETENQRLMLVIHLYNLPLQLCQDLKSFCSPPALLQAIARGYDVPSHVTVMLG